MDIKKGDKIIVMKGKDRGKTAKVEKALPKTKAIIAAGINVYKKHLKRTQKNPYGGIVDVSMPIARANIRLICPRCEKATRLSYKVSSKNNKIRICQKCGEPVD